MKDAGRKRSNPEQASGLRRLTRCAVPAIDELLGKPWAVLDDGFVRVIDYMGNDAAIVQAAKVSYGLGLKSASENRAIIRNLIRHLHTTPFEMCEIKLHVRAPMDVWKQWIRHRTANVNEHSTGDAIAASAQATPSSGWRMQSSKQDGATLPLEVGQMLSARELEFQKMSREIYEERVSAGVAKDQARKDLPLSTYTEAYWKIDLHNLLHFLHLRMGEHAQREIRLYAQLIGEQIVAKWVPLAWEAFLEYRQNATVLSATEAEVLRALISNAPERAKAVAESAGLLAFDKEGKATRNFERAELESKLLSLGVTPPWL